ncbi:hypothetical protein [Roseibacillus ishigakijimensis]|uniref:Uncharacterized protein n=1 Tax=Roseibacillus ishigakijimensis TaxID=454146 RepID=A0A934VN16_9BACT|nr:hypothetical protein [Roseibacillus ishigakijimensis]MBK1834842.1 hypothetical protein [Roseibacillus ishigakijimensis]
MSWTQIFPYLTDDQLEEYEQEVTTGERAEFEEMLGVSKVYNRQRGRRHIVTMTLFWKNVNADQPDLVTPTWQRLTQARRWGLVRRFDPYESYVEPLLLHGPALTRKHPEVCFRVYLAADLDFLIAPLTEAGFEVQHMKSSSQRYCPGGFWRFLALAERGKLITVMDTDRIRFAEEELARTHAMHESELSLWRVPGYYNAPIRENVAYRPLLGGHMGARGGVAIRQWMEAFIWHNRRGTMPKLVELPGCRPVPVKANQWPNYGFDEWWQLAIYPRLAARGVLTFVPTDARSQILPLDIEFTTWINSKSEMVYFQAGGACC